MKESKLIEMRNRIENLEKVVTAVLLRLEKIEEEKKLEKEEADTDSSNKKYPIVSESHL